MLYAFSLTVVQLLPDLAGLGRLAEVGHGIVGPGCSRSYKRLKFSTNVCNSYTHLGHPINKQ